MPGGPELLERVIREWVEDPDSDVVHAEEVEGRWAVRMRQQVRDATTVWWEVGQRTIRAEAYVLPAPEAGREEVFRLCLARNLRAWRAHFALDREGAIVLLGRLDRQEADAATLDLLLGEVYEMVETTFRPLVRLAFPPRERKR